MFPKLHAIKSWYRSLEAMVRIERGGRLASDDSGEESHSRWEMGRVLRDCDECRLHRICEEHRREFDL
jgi:hypothetical protein